MLRRDERKLNRPDPALPMQAMSTYRIDAPLATHWVDATCAEVDCPPYLNGWRSVIDESTELGQAQAAYIRGHSGRSYREERDELGMTVFWFSAGQTCFRGDDHHRRLDRPEAFRVLRGLDWRVLDDEKRAPAYVAAAPTWRPVDWVEHMQEGLESLQQRAERG